jgi:hypothetical protein
MAALLSYLVEPVTPRTATGGLLCCCGAGFLSVFLFVAVLLQASCRFHDTKNLKKSGFFPCNCSSGCIEYVNPRIHLLGSESSIAWTLTGRFMSDHGRRGWIRIGLGAALLLLASTWMAPSSAHASCGDYVSFGRKGSMQPAHELPAGKHSTPLPKPCSGPHCSQSSMPLTPPPSTVPVEEDRWLAALPILLPLLCRAWLVLPTTDSLQAIHQPSSIYHPPR